MPPFRETQRQRRRGRGDFRDLKKHFVRVNGWLPILRVHARRTGSQVKYLTLCAKEAIDVRYFANEGLIPRNREANEYPTLTFVESDEEDYAIIAETLGRVRLAIRGRIETVLLDRTHASHGELVESFPHDVINLDFCGDVVPPNDHPYSTTLRCIDKTIQLEAESQADTWHLFVTFRAQGGRGNPEAVAELTQVISDNLSDDTCRAAYGGRPLPAQLQVDTFHEFLRLGVAKFIAHRASHWGYAVVIESSWVYGRRDATYHIVKLVMGFTRFQRQGQLPNPGQQHGTYQDGVRAIFRSNATDVDQRLETAASRAQVQRALAPILAELNRLGVVDA